MKAMESIQNLIEEAKVQTVWWGLCIFSLTYFLTNTSKSMWINLPVAILILLGLRWFNQIEFRSNVMPAPRQSWEKNIDSLLYFLNKKQLSLNDTIPPPPPSWKKNINSSVVEAAINDFIDKILNDFVINLWYSSITKDKEAPELIHGVIMDALGEISVRLKQINILDLLTRDIVDLIGDHIESFRRNYAAIGTDVMKKLSSEERDERLKCHLMSSGELYPALISSESEYKVLQNIVDGIFSVVLGPREANCPLVRTIVREIVTCLIVQPLLNLASPERINEVLVIIINGIKERNFEQFLGEEQSANPASLSAFDNQAKNMNLTKNNEQKTPLIDDERHPELRIQQHAADWARMVEDFSRSASCEGERHMCEVNVRKESPSDGNKNRLKRSNSTSDLLHPVTRLALLGVGDNKSPNTVLHKKSQHCPKLKCRVLGADLEKFSSNIFAVYYVIAVTDTENKSWFVKRSYSTFKLLHRQLEEIPNYNLRLPPERIFSPSTEDAFVHRLCILMDKYLQALLSIANVAEQHDVMDFLCASSKNYSFGKSSSVTVVKTLTVNVDDAMDIATESMHSSISDNEDIDKRKESTKGEGRLVSEANGRHSDNELGKYLPPRVVRRIVESEKPPSEMENDLKAKFEVRGFSDLQHADPLPSLAHNPTGMPPEWMPPNATVPILNLVDKVFQLYRGCWIRRQVFWISKQILQLVMEDAVDDWLLKEVYWLRNENTVAHGIRWAQDLLWPNGVFFTRVIDGQEASDGTGQLGGMKVAKPSSFDQQLNAAIRVHKIKKFLYDGAPTALVKLVGSNQYRRCARDIFNFTQSNVCIKQLTFAILELLVRTVFPELQDLLGDIRKNSHGRSE